MEKTIITVLAVLFAVIIHRVDAADLFVRPQGCANDVQLIIDDSYREMVNYTVGQCAAQCLADGTYCRSFSYYDNPANATKTCSLNLGHSDEAWTGLRYAQNWTYYERIPATTGVDNYGVVNIATCTPNTFRDCRTAYLATNNGESRQIWMKLDNRTNAIPAYCRNGQDILMMQRTGIGFYDISWNRPWEEYKYGFGRDVNNFWYGLYNMYRIVNQDALVRLNSSGRCLLPKKMNGTTTRFTLSEATALNRCPWFSIRADGKVVLSLRSLCICEDTVNAGGAGHGALCGCNEPNRYQFIWSPTLGLVISSRPNGGNKCLKVNADAAGEEVVVADCNQDDVAQKWYLQKGRYRNYWGGWDLSNTYRDICAVHTEMSDEAWNYKIYADPIYGCGLLWAKVQQWMSFSTYDRDRDPETGLNVAMRQAGGDWWNAYASGSAGEPKLTSQKDVSQYTFCNNAWLMNSFMALQADDYWY